MNLFVEDQLALAGDLQPVERLAMGDADLVFTTLEQAGACNGAHAEPRQFDMNRALGNDPHAGGDAGRRCRCSSPVLSKGLSAAMAARSDRHIS